MGEEFGDHHDNQEDAVQDEVHVMFIVYMFYNYYENLYIEFVSYDVCSINRTRPKQSGVTV